MSPQSRRKPIKPLASGARSMVLDENYGTPTATVFHGRRLCSVDAYTEAGSILKEKFLSDAARFARMVARELYHFGFREHEVRINRAGMAVSGEVYAEIFHPDHERWMFFWIESSSGTLSSRQDTVVITARWREAVGRPHSQDRHRVVDGPSQLISASLDTYAVAVRLLPLLGIDATACGVAPTQEPLSATQRSRPPTVSTDMESQPAASQPTQVSVFSADQNFCW